MEKKKYESLEISVVMFGKKDVLAASTVDSENPAGLDYTLGNNQTKIVLPNWV